MEAVSVLTAVASTQFLAAASPGPTFVVVTSHATGRSRTAGLQAAAGVLAATLMWATVAAAGPGAVLARAPWLHSALQLAGAAYLMYLGARMVVGALRRGAGAAVAGRAATLPGWPAVRAGFLTNVANPKSVAYYASLFAAMVPPGSAGWLVPVAVAVALLVSAAWWTSVALLFSLPHVRHAYDRAKRPVEAVAGDVLIALGCRLAASR